MLSGEYAIESDENYQRFCSNFLATKAEGFDRPLFFTNEEGIDWVNKRGTAWPAVIGADEARQIGAVVAIDPKSDKVKPIWGMGRHNHENSVAVPGYGKPVVLSGDDSFVSNPAQSQLYSYIAKNSNDVWKDRGDLWAFVADAPGVDDYYDFPVGSSMSVAGRFVKVPKDVATGHAPDGSELMAADKGYPLPPNDGTWQRDPNGVGLDGPQWVLEHWGDTQTKPVFQFTRVEDIAYDRRRGMQNVVYVVDSGRGATSAGGNAFTSTNGRVWKLVLDPEGPDPGALVLSPDRGRRRSGQGRRRDPPAGQHRVDREEPALHGGSRLEPAVPGRVDRPGCDHGKDLAVRPRGRLEACGREGRISRQTKARPTRMRHRWATSAPGSRAASSMPRRCSGLGAFLVDVQAGTLVIDEEVRGNLTYQRDGGQLGLLRIPGA